MNSSSNMNHYRAPMSAYEAGQERRDEAALQMGRAIAAQSKLNLERSKLALYPEVGTLNRSGETIFYAHVNGVYFEHRDLDVVTRKVSPLPRIVRASV